MARYFEPLWPSPGSRWSRPTIAYSSLAGIEREISRAIKSSSSYYRLASDFTRRETEYTTMDDGQLCHSFPYKRCAVEISCP
ncbi:hypothetical protein J6590_009672 [Homalodisca vitripennis]|nr:hypothetical protein J6590_009672 [Homalodisca vitripennis]